MTAPIPEQIRVARDAAGQTQAEAATLIHLERRMTWADYEAGRRQMPAASWELYLLRTGQHPRWQLAQKG